MKLPDAILKTLEYFDVQDRPLTLIEIHKYLLGPVEHEHRPVQLSAIITAVESLHGKIVTSEGFYALAGREEIIASRKSNNSYSIPRMRRVRKYLPLARHIPFIRGAALSGSEALSSSKKGSDIDILLFTDSRRIWTARFFATAFYQALGIRRHGNYIENRFCLNHYIAGIKRIENDNNLYTAVEYVSLVAYAGGETITKFQRENQAWIKTYLPNFQPIDRLALPKSGLQKSIEFLLNGWIGGIIESLLGGMQRRRIIAQTYITIERDELSFHPGSKGQQVLQRFSERNS